MGGHVVSKTNHEKGCHEQSAGADALIDMAANRTLVVTVGRWGYRSSAELFLAMTGGMTEGQDRCGSLVHVGSGLGG